MSRVVVRAGLLAVCLVALACDAPGGGGPLTSPVSQPRTVELVQSDRPPPPSDVAEVVQRVLPSVVNVRVTALQGGGQARGEGSGVVIAAQGVILTNAHVVRNALEVTVVLADGRELDGEVVGAACERDLAVVEVQADDLEPITLGHSGGPDGARLGDGVVAIGFPLGIDGGPTVTAGIVSGKGRNVTVGDPGGEPLTLVGLLQTDAAINPGNSGGPLVDMSGQLIGINSAAAAAAAAENVGFAIAIDDALPVVREMLEEPAEERAWLGVSSRPVDDFIAAQLGLPPGTSGALIEFVFPGSPAEDAGIEVGEVIAAIEGDGVASGTELAERLADLGAGDRVALELVSPGDRRTVAVELGRRPPAFSEC